MKKQLPSKWKGVNRVIVDSDMDGVMCGAILRMVFPNAEIMQSRASDIQEGKIDEKIDKNTLLADLRFSPKAGFYFDHHESNKPEQDFLGAWKPYDSAARVVYEYFKDYAEIEKFDSILKDVDKFDSGKLSLEEFNNPSNVIQLSLVVDRDDEDFNLSLIEDLSKKNFDEVYLQDYVQNKINKYLKARTNLTDYIVNNHKSSDRYVIVDLRNYNTDQKMGSYVFTSYFAKADAVVVLKRHKNQGLIKVRLYRNNFYKTNSDLNLLNIAMKISPETAGGHKGACGFNIKKEKLDEMHKILQEELTK